MKRMLKRMLRRVGFWDAWSLMFLPVVLVTVYAFLVIYMRSHAT